MNLSRLSPAERRVVRAVCEGMTGRQAAAHLGISTKTVEAHIHNVRRKMGFPPYAHLATTLLRLRVEELQGELALLKAQPVCLYPTSNLTSNLSGTVTVDATTWPWEERLP